MTSRHVRALEGRVQRTATRMVEQATRDGVSVADLPRMRLRWYAMRDAGAPPERGGDETTATVLVYDEIGGSFGVSAQQFAEDLQEITADTITLRINSPGGSVWDARAIANSLRHHPARVLGYVDGMCASAATIVAMAADELTVMPGGEMMIHDASALEDGNPRDHEQVATFLHRESDEEARNYAAKAGGDPQEWRERMTSETWLFGDEAVALGLADKVGDRGTEPAVTDERMRRSFDLAGFGYRYAGRAQAPNPSLVIRAGGASVRHRATIGRDRRQADPAVQERAAAAQLRQRVAGAGRMTQRGTLGVGLGRSVGLGSACRLNRSAGLVTFRGREMYRTEGYWTVYDQQYEMWDALGPYFEDMRPGSADASLAATPDVPFLVNHTGLTMARTAGPWNDFRGTLELRADERGGWHEAFHNPARSDVQMMMSGIDDGLITEMSFRFLIVDGRWDDRFENYSVHQFDVNRGDVSGVNLGANPYTDISARAHELMADLDALPLGAIREVQRRLGGRIDAYEQLVRGLDAPQLERVTEFAEAARSDDAGARAVAHSVGRDIIARIDVSAGGDKPAANPDAHQGTGRSFSDIEALLRTL
jgi:ATP-dependent protease ClpP protease subunit/phage head maturation protease